MTSRAYLSSRAEGGFSDSVPSSRGEVDLRLAAPRLRGPPADGSPRPRPPTQSSEPGTRLLPAGGGPETAARPDLDSAESGAPGGGRGGRPGGRAAPAFLLSSGDAACNSEIKSPPTHLWFFKYSRGRLPRQGPPRLKGGVEGDGGWQGRENKTPFFPSFFLLFLVQDSVCHFLNPNQTTACERRLGERWYVGFGVFKAKNKRGLPPKLLRTLGLEPGGEMVF